MSNQFDGYVFDILYDDNFYSDLTPTHIETVLRLNGLSLPRYEDGEPFRYLELGYGQGMSLNLNAAACKGEFWGTDFNPNHCLAARSLSMQTGAKTKILNDSFEELYEKSKSNALPQFDMIALHGVWSWITEDSRKYILQIISRNLKVGGAVYVSYNCMPGWADFTPLRELLTYHAKTQSATKNSISKVQEAYKFVAELEKNGAQYFVRNSSATAKFKGVGDKSISYVAHEYFNEDWYVPYFKDVAADFENAKCTFASSSRILNQLPIAMTAEIQAMLNGISDLKLRETVRDFALNTQFRADIFVKGVPTQAPSEFENLKLALCVNKEAISYSINVAIGTLNLKEEAYKPFVEYLASDDYQPKSIKQIKEALPNISMSTLHEAICVLFGAKYLNLAKEVQEEQRISAKKFNGQMCQRAIKGLSPHALASPVLGAGVAVNNLEMMFLVALHKGKTQTQELASFTYDIMKTHGQELKKDEVSLNEIEAMKELQELATQFLQNRLPLLQRLCVEIEIN